MKMASPQAIASSVDPKPQSTRLARGPDHILKMGLEDWHHAPLQLSQFLEIAFTAKHVVADLRQASRGRKSYVACADD